MGRDVAGAGGHFGIDVFLGQEVDQRGHLFRVLGLLEADNAGAAGHARACASRTAGAADDLPVEEIADLFVHAADLPAAGIVEDQIAIDELLGRVLIGRAALAGPDIARDGAVIVPIDELLDEGGEALIDQRGVAVLIEQRRAIGDGRARDAVTGAVDRHREGCAGGFGHGAGGFGPIGPGCASARHLDAGLLEQGGVDEGAGDGQLRVHAVDALTVRPAAIPVERAAEAVSQ
jgi:hypothetical protein